MTLYSTGVEFEDWNSMSLKWSIMHLAHLRSPPVHFHTLGGEVICSVSESKYLGVVLSDNYGSSSSQWKAHINSMVSKASQKLGFLRRNMRGSPYKLRALAYVILVRSSLEYCGSVWDPTLKGEAEKLKRVQKRGAHWARGAVASFLLLLYWTTLAVLVWPTGGGTNVYVYFINFWTNTLRYQQRNLSSILQPWNQDLAQQEAAETIREGPALPVVEVHHITTYSRVILITSAYSWGLNYYLLQVLADLQTIECTPSPTSTCCLVRGGQQNFSSYLVYANCRLILVTKLSRGNHLDNIGVVVRRQPTLAGKNIAHELSTIRPVNNQVGGYPIIAQPTTYLMIYLGSFYRPPNAGSEPLNQLDSALRPPI